jgi:hypothetical protein
MVRRKIKHFSILAALLFVIGSVDAQDRRRVGSQTVVSTGQCVLNGTFRIDVAASDRLYSVVKNAKSSVPFAEQQRFFMDLSTRLTPPDILAIECKGRQVTVGSSRANKITYLADGRNRREQLPDGSFVNSKISLDKDLLTFVSVGKAEDNVNVAFESLDAGRRMRVTRRIYAKQLSDPIVIQTLYSRISDGVDWKIYEGNLLADQMASDQSQRPRPDNPAERNRIDTLRAEFASWMDATNRRDIDGQMRFYMPQLKAYYLARNAPRRIVRLEKERIFGVARSVDIRAGEPEIVFQNGGRTAVMRFVKEYRVSERSRTRQGAVIQELRWESTESGWRIFSERDVRVLR